MMVDTREPEVAEEALQQQPIQLSGQLSFMDALNSMAQISLAEDDAQIILQRVTDIVGKTLAVDHCLIYHIDFEQHQAIRLGEWLNPQYPNLANLSCTKTICNLDLFNAGCRHLQGSQGWLESHIDSINPCLLEDGSAVLLHEERRIQSLLWYPFYFLQQGYYLLIFNQVSYQRRWQQEEIAFIKTTTSQVSIALQKIHILAERQQVEEALRKANKELEIQVEERTVALRNAVKRLHSKIANSKAKASRRVPQQTEEALQISEQRFRAVFEKTAIGMGLVNVTGQLIASNPALHKIIGYDAEELRTMTLVDYTHPDDVAADLALYQELLAGKLDYYQMEKRFIKKNGELFWGRLTVSAIRCTTGEIQFTFGTVEDINERKQAEKALQESEERFRLIAEAIPIPVLITRVSDSKVLYANASLGPTFGLSSEELLGRTIVDFYYDPVVDRPDLLGMMQRDGYVNNYELRVKKTDDTPFWVLLSARFLKVNNESAMLTTFYDLTQRKQAEEALQESEARSREQAQQLEQTLQELQRTQSQLIQTEKMSSLGQLVAGVAHEINNPVTFIYCNLTPATEYIEDLLHLLRVYQQHYPKPLPGVQAETEAIDLDFLVEDLPKILSSMKIGADRIREIVLSLRNFSRLDEAEIKPVDLHEGLNNTLLILQSRLKAKPERPAIQVIKEYGSLPEVECYAGQLNQVFMNILINAIDALEELNVERFSVQSRNLSKNVAQVEGSEDNRPYPLKNGNAYENPAKEQPTIPCIWIRTEIGSYGISNLSQVNPQWVRIRIADNGPGMTQEVKQRLFDPFFTTKPVGQGTGLGLSISYQIVVDKHGGQLWCNSVPGRGTEFFIEIPIFYRQKRTSSVR
jgi:PAS domain S-box-containing protein